jgi:hypothetical protein
MVRAFDVTAMPWRDQAQRLALPKPDEKPMTW